MPEYEWEKWEERIEGDSYRDWWNDVYTDYDTEELVEIALTIYQTMMSQGYSQDWGRELNREGIEQNNQPVLPRRGLVEPGKEESFFELCDRDEIPKKYWAFQQPEEPFGFTNESDIDFHLWLPPFERDILFEAGFMVPDLWLETSESYEEEINDRYDVDTVIESLKEDLQIIREWEPEDDDKIRLSDEPPKVNWLTKHGFQSMGERELEKFIEYAKDNPEILVQQMEAHTERMAEPKPSEEELDRWRKDVSNIKSEYEDQLQYSQINIPEKRRDTLIIEMKVPEEAEEDEIKNELRTGTEMMEEVRIHTPWATIL